MATPDLLTADDLLALNIQDKRTELVRGRLIVREGFVRAALEGEDVLPGFICPVEGPV